MFTFMRECEQVIEKKKKKQRKKEGIESDGKQALYIPYKVIGD